MVLNGNTIKELFKKNLLVENGNIDNVHSSSYDVTSSEYILKIKKSKKDIYLIDAKKLESMYKVINIKDGYRLKPG